MGNPHTKAAGIDLELAAQADTYDFHLARAGAEAQLAVAYELNTIARLLAFKAMDGTYLVDDLPSGANLSKSIAERLGL